MPVPSGVSRHARPASGNTTSSASARRRSSAAPRTRQRTSAVTVAAPEQHAAQRDRAVHVGPDDEQQRDRPVPLAHQEREQQGNRQQAEELGTQRPRARQQRQPAIIRTHFVPVRPTMSR